MIKLLLVEDEVKLVAALTHLLKKNGYLVDSATNGQTGLEKGLMGGYDLIILDWMLPLKNGLSIIKELRRNGITNPVIFLTAKDEPRNRVEGLDSGADDYLIKPFSSEELLARLRALSRRRTKQIIENKVNVSGLSLDPLKCEVIKGFLSSPYYL